MDGNLAKVDQEKAVHCDEWDTVIKKCPTNCIVRIGGQETELKIEDDENGILYD